MLITPKAQTRVKICGITSVADAVTARNAGADAIGIVFYESSPRAVMDLTLARDIALAAGPFVSVVGLFVNADTEFVERVLKYVPLSCLQFHGDESLVFCESFARPYMKAIRMKDGLDVNAAIDNYPSASAILLDSYVKGVPGGTGERFNWDRIPQTKTHIVLAGGLTASNVAEAVSVARPYAVDVSGGVERAPGKKNPDKIQAFISNAKSE